LGFIIAFFINNVLKICLGGACFIPPSPHPHPRVHLCCLSSTDATTLHWWWFVAGTLHKESYYWIIGKSSDWMSPRTKGNFLSKYVLLVNTSTVKRP
jgi:hypothetical protein